jgi:hypothetical protein
MVSGIQAIVKAQEITSCLGNEDDEYSFRNSEADCCRFSGLK